MLLSLPNGPPVTIPPCSFSLLLVISKSIMDHPTRFSSKGPPITIPCSLWLLWLISRNDYIGSSTTVLFQQAPRPKLIRPQCLHPASSPSVLSRRIFWWLFLYRPPVISSYPPPAPLFLFYQKTIFSSLPMVPLDPFLHFCLYSIESDFKRTLNILCLPSVSCTNVPFHFSFH